MYECQQHNNSTLTDVTIDYIFDRVSNDTLGRSGEPIDWYVPGVEVGSLVIGMYLLYEHNSLTSLQLLM